MVKILTAKDREIAARRLTICYLCGMPLGVGRGVGWNVDHTPPTAYVTGRAAALPLRTHPTCNDAWSARDEAAGQLMSTMIRRYPSSPEKTRIDVTKFTDVSTGQSFYGVLNFGIEKDVVRIVRAFHAALYGEYLPPRGINVSLPFPTGHAPKGVPEPEPPPDWHGAIVVGLAMAEESERVDRLMCEGRECEYICTWIPDRRKCVFGLRLHHWGDLGEPAFGQRGCVGFYDVDTVPAQATAAPSILIPVEPRNPLDPFPPTLHIP